MALPIKRTENRRKNREDFELSNEQAMFVKYAIEGKNILVNACIGSGKTTSIQYLCNEMSEKKILYLTYNKLLKLDAKKKIKNKNVVVQNYHGFAYGILKKSGIDCSVSDCVVKFNEIKPAISVYDVLIIDEYQDIETEFADMLEYIKKSNQGMQLIAVGDMDQKIYDKTSLDVECFIQKFLEPDYIELAFTQCFRLSKDIAELLGRIWMKTINGVNDACEVDQMELDDVKSFLKEQDPKDILCLGSRVGNMAKVLNDLEIEMPEKYNKKTVYASIRDKDSCGVTKPKSTSAIFTTFDSSKGLERPICIIFDWTYSYWISRIKRPDQSYKILKNIFCVAASRGKEKIIFVPAEDGLLSEEEIMTDITNKNRYLEIQLINEVFEFKYKEDLEAACKCLDVTSMRIDGKDDSVIRINENDELIDLRPCIIYYLKAFYLKKYKIFSCIEQIYKARPNEKCDPDIREASLEEKILYLVSLETRQIRYRKQVEIPFIKQFQKNQLEYRMSEILNKDDDAQIFCSLGFVDETGKRLFDAIGFADVVKEDTIFNLYYTEQFSHENYLITACHMVALGKDKGFLWNLYNNQMCCIKIPDKHKFMDAVAVAITKGKLKKYYGDIL